MIDLTIILGQMLRFFVNRAPEVLQWHLFRQNSESCPQHQLNSNGVLADLDFADDMVLMVTLSPVTLAPKS